MIARLWQRLRRGKGRPCYWLTSQTVGVIVISWLVTVLLMAVLALALTFDHESKDKFDVATIGGTNVPTVECQEDEVIWWTGIDTLGCVHFEEVQ